MVKNIVHNNRNNSRVTLPLEVLIHCDNGSNFQGVVKDISISGVNIKISTTYDLRSCLGGLLIVKFGSKDDPYAAEFFFETARFDHDSVTCILKETDMASFRNLKMAILRHALNPEKLINEIKFNQNLSINSLYLPALMESISSLIKDSVESIFRIYLETNGYSGKIIIITADHRSDNARLGAKVGANGFLAKPVDRKAICNLVDQFVLRV